MSDGFHKNMKNHNIDNKKKCHHIRVISEGSCDTEDAENKLHVTIYSHRKQHFKM